LDTAAETSANGAAPFAYDAVFYPGHAFEQTHPDRLATIASLFGVQPCPIGRCRVLELGCGLGGNLLPMAAELPESEFVGIDLSGPTIALGVANIERLGLRNITLSHRDIMDVGEDFGRFDYIVAHGVYSWVPQFVRDKMWDIFRRNLNPQGVVYVSYNAYPGSHFRDLTREMMLHHVAAIGDPMQRVQQGRGLMKLLADATPADKPYGIVMREQFERVANMPDEVLYHDDLTADARAFFLRQVTDDAAHAGMQYLSEATFAHTSFGGHGEKITRIVQSIPDTQFIEREQYLDFFVGRGFHESLFCHGNVALRRDVGASCLRSYWLAGTMRADQDVDPTAPGVVKFNVSKTASISTDHQLSKAALVLLADAWPGALRFDDLVQGATDRLAARGVTLGAERDEQIEALATLLFRAFCYNYLHVHFDAPRLTPAVSDRPRASVVARHEADAGPLITTLRHRLVQLDDPTVRRFLTLLDGTHTVEDLTVLLRERIKGDAGAPREITRASVVHHLENFARLGLLID
jgi:SAM-dependent methyltransferase